MTPLKNTNSTQCVYSIIQLWKQTKYWPTVTLDWKRAFEIFNRKLWIQEWTNRRCFVLDPVPIGICRPLLYQFRQSFNQEITFLAQVKISHNSQFKQKRLVWKSRKSEIIKQVPNYLMSSQIYVKTFRQLLRWQFFCMLLNHSDVYVMTWCNVL